jgi:hypothetical protein
MPSIRPFQAIKFPRINRQTGRVGPRNSKLSMRVESAVIAIWRIGWPAYTFRTENGESEFRADGCLAAAVPRTIVR